jgi:hypothetical protein
VTQEEFNNLLVGDVVIVNTWDIKFQFEAAVWDLKNYDLDPDVETVSYIGKFNGKTQMGESSPSQTTFVRHHPRIEKLLNIPVISPQVTELKDVLCFITKTEDPLPLLKLQYALMAKLRMITEKQFPYTV